MVLRMKLVYWANSTILLKHTPDDLPDLMDLDSMPSVYSVNQSIRKISTI